MPPSGSGKRKRAERTFSQDDSARPSPHRPGNLDLSRQSQPQSPNTSRNGQDSRGSDYRRGSRGGKGMINPSSPIVSKMVDPQVSHAKIPTPGHAPIHNPQNVLAVATPPTSVVAPVEHRKPRPYCYIYITEELQESWSAEGRSRLQQQISEKIQDEDDIQATVMMQEIVHAVCEGKIPPDQVGTDLKDAIGSLQDGRARSAEAQQTILDAVSILSEENSSLAVGPLAEFLTALEVGEDILRLGLDQSLLLKLGLISGRFKQMGIRKQTNTLYRQANFNLMREEPEGFAKLITELFTTSGNELPTGEVVRETVERVKAMIGAFDLDVGRSLDVILDVFGSVLVRHNRFLVKLLRASPWWPQGQGAITGSDKEMSSLPRWAAPEASDYQLSERDREELASVAVKRDESFWPRARQNGLLAFQQIGRIMASTQAVQNAQNSTDNSLTDQWIQATRTLPVSGNRDAAQLLGFKLRFYSSSDARGPNDNLPDNLIHLSALLIKIGFISLSDLYPHIWRSDQEMEELREQKVKEKADRERAARPGAGIKNALAMAGALADDSLPIPSVRLREPITRSGTPIREAEVDKATSKDIVVETPDQKVMLLKSLLAIGALPEALFILGRFPWIIDLYPELPEYINRILHHCLSEVYDKLRPLDSRESLKSQKPVAEVDTASLAKGQVRLTEIPLKKTLKWAGLDRNDSGDGIDYRFYWDDWNDNIPICRTIDDVFTLCDTLLNLVGVKIGQDPTLVLKIARIGKHSLAHDSSEQNKKRWLDLIKKVLLPCLSLTKSNAGVVNEVFELISHYPTTTRYLMYLEWSSGRTSRIPDIAVAFDQARAETKDILKRISKTNVKPMARSLAKIAYGNPHVVITTALTQIEVYDSIAEVFVEGARYFTDLGYDVLTWALISSMGRAGRSRTQDGGMFASRWLSALSQFAGKIYKRYSMMKAGPVLQYVAEQLGHGISTDLKMLEQLVVSMAGIATDTNFNDAQLQAMGGGPLLQSQTILQLLDRRSDSKTTSKRLIKSLQENSLTAKILVSLAQQRQASVFDDNDIPLKAIGNTFDELTRVMGQYVDLLRSNLTLEEFENTVPDVVQLLLDYEIPAEIAFGIQRPLISKRIAEIDRESSEANKVNGTKLTNGDVDMDEHEASEEDGEAVDQDDIPTTAAATPSEMEINGNMDVDESETKHSQDRWHPALKPIMDALQDNLPADVVDVIGVGFYVTFWQLSLYDISVPSKSYEDEMGRQRKRVSAITSDRANVSATGARTREANIKQHQQIIDELLQENKQHIRAQSESRSRLTREKDQWFFNKQRQQEQINVILMEYCFLPRILSSPLDAFFCFKFVKYLHVNSTPNFRTLGFYDRFLKTERLTSLFFMCTSQESDNLGRFLRELLQDLARWHKDQKTYEREAFGSKKNLIGFAMKIENGKPQVLLDFEAFRRIVFKWHAGIYMALSKCLSSAEYMHVRNAISILRAISPIYPAVNFHGTSLQKAVDKVRTSDREDLQVAAGALLGALHRREKEWVAPQFFRQGQEKAEVEAKSMTPNPDELMNDKPVANSIKENGEVGEVDMTDAPVKKEISGAKSTTEEAPRSGPRVTELARDLSRPSTSNGPISTSRPDSDIGLLDRRSRPFDRSSSHNLPRRLSPPHHQLPANLPTRPEAHSRNGYRDSPNIPPRPSANETPRSDSRSGYPRAGPPDRVSESSYEQPHRHTKVHDRPSMLDRDDRPHRREHDSRHSNNDERRQPERDIRGERELRSDRETSRGQDRDSRHAEREHGRLQPELDRKRVDLAEHERRPTPSAPSRSEVTQPAPVGINPERAALIGHAEARPDISIRGQAQDKPRSSHPSSPRREDGRRHQSRSDRDERPERRSEHPPRPAVPHQQQEDRSVHPASYNRDTRQQNPPPLDMRHGRLEPESPQQAVPRNERPPETEVPSGPRGRHGANNSRPRSSISNAPPPQAPERPTPTGPARHGRNGSMQEVPKPQDTVGVHPDRMNQIAATDQPRGGPRPQQINTQIPPPSGPRGGAPPTPSGPSPISRGPPTGPQADGNGRGRRTQLDALNNQLTQSQGSNGRGRGGMRQGSGPLPPHMPPPGPGSRPQYGQPDPSNPNGMPIQPRPNSSRREGAKDVQPEEDGRSSRSGKDREGRNDRRNEEPRRNDRKDEQSREQRVSRTGPTEDLPPRKHLREDGTHYGGYSRGGSRIVSDNKRPKRGG